MIGPVLGRLAWTVPMLVGISLVTFLMLDLLPVDAAAARLAQREVDATDAAAVEARERALFEIRVRNGLIDPVRGEPRPFVERWVDWVGRAARLEVAPPGETPQAFRRRLGQAIVTSAALGTSAAALALVVGVAVGTALGLLAGRVADRVASPLLLFTAALPEFLIATLVLLVIGWAGTDWPVAGLGTPGSEGWPWWRRVGDGLRHAALPVAVLALTPTVWAIRLVRDAVARTARADWVTSERLWGVPRRVTVLRIVANSLAPVWTWLGTVLPALVTATVVVEQVFRIPGVGQIAVNSVLQRDVTTVTLLTLYTATLVLFALVFADLGQWASDRRVRLR